MLETNFAPANTFIEFDSIVVGSNAITLGLINQLGTGTGAATIFAGTLTDQNINDITSITIDNVSIGTLTIDKSSPVWTIAGPGLDGILSTLDSETGDFSIVFSSAPAIGEVISMEFTSLNSEWSSISGIRQDYRILTDNEEGLVLIESDPQFQVSVTPGLVQIVPLNTKYYPGEWILRVPSTYNVNRLLPRYTQSSLVLTDYLASLQDISIDEINDSAIRLRNLRRWDVMDSEYLDQYLQTLGLFFKSEIFDIETRRRFIKELPTFLELSGTRFTFNYLSFVVGAIFEIKHLWSSDYKVFIPQDDIPSGQEDFYYPTNHVELNFDTEVFGAIEPDLILSIFYVLASTPLVLDRINQELVSDLIQVNNVMLGTFTTFYVAEDLTP